ncbi:hypothetical protein HHI36_016125 [Cryptolaemus montrouzieri]|uniref:Uncharacterized protein n=1 Tax=Cryptolaemus montrouzieri TaxID=559131 RepID=A0ABD2NIM1_9CUCU
MLIEVALKLNIRGYEIPWDKFGWFYDRNMSEYYDGNYTMWTGEDDIAKTGIVTVWDENPKSVDYEGQCSEINGTTGEVWGPVPEDAETVSMFISDTCSKLTLERNGTQTVNGIKGNKYIATEKLFDNGTKYKENACFSPGEPVPSGVRNISECKFKAPAFISLPHFYLADEYYRNAVEGMKPDPENHSLYLVIEPNTGLPLHVQASVQCNLRMYQVDGIDMFANVEDTMVPMIWLKVTAKIPDNDVFLLKFALAAPTIGLIVGYVLIVLGISLLSWSIYRRKNNSKKANVFDKNI